MILSGEVNRADREQGLSVRDGPATKSAGYSAAGYPAHVLAMISGKYATKIDFVGGGGVGEGYQDR